MYAEDKITKGITLRKHYISVLDISFPMHYFVEMTQNYLFDIRLRMNWLNEEVEHALYYLQLTFDENITGENRIIIGNNLKDSYHHYAEDAKLLVNSISKIIF